MESPKNIGRYQVEGELGRGAMGVVFKAHDPVVQRVVAIKTIPLGIEGSDVLVSRLQSEAKSVGRLEHPNIVTLYDAGEAEGVFYMAMQFVRGETLRDRMNRQRWFPLNEIQKILRQICSALDYAHRHGVIHRDVKPANIMIAPDEVVKLTDFGIAKVVGAETTTPGMTMGSPSYMSPEQALGRPLDGRSNLFSLGSILYELITGERAFPGTNVTTIIYRIVHEPPSSLTAIQPGLHPALEAIVLKALEKQPE
jgi:eukaryotic-like serine/threonine-protein kinase